MPYVPTHTARMTHREVRASMRFPVSRATHEIRVEASVADHFRKWARYPVRLRVTVRRQFDRSTGEVSGVVENLSFGGAFVSVDTTVQPGTRIVVGINSATTWDPLRLPSTVRWVREGKRPGTAGIGVAFDPISRETALALFRLFNATDYDHES